MSSAANVSGSSQPVVVKAKVAIASGVQSKVVEHFSVLTVLDNNIMILEAQELRLDDAGLKQLIGYREEKLGQLQGVLTKNKGDLVLLSQIKKLAGQLLVNYGKLNLSDAQPLKIEELTQLVAQLQEQIESAEKLQSAASSSASAMGFGLPDDAVSAGGAGDGGFIMASPYSSMPTLSTQHSGAAVTYTYAPLVDDDGDDGKHAGHAAAGGSELEEVDEGKEARGSSGAKFAEVKNVSFEVVLAHINGSSSGLINFCNGGSPAVTLKKLAFTNIKTSVVVHMSVFEVICNKKGEPETYYVWDERTRRPDGAAIEYSRGKVRDRIPGLVSCNVDGLKIGGSLFKIQGAEHRFLAKG